MATFKSDAQGFLVGDLLNTDRALVRSAERERAAWRGIAVDVQAIAAAIGATRAKLPRAAVGWHGEAVEPTGRGASGLAAPDGAAKRQAAAIARVAAATAIAAVTPTLRGVARHPAEVEPLGSVQPAQATSAMQPAQEQAVTGSIEVSGRAVSGGPVGAEGGDVTQEVAAALRDLAGDSAARVGRPLHAVAEIGQVNAPHGRGMFSPTVQRRKEARGDRWRARILAALGRAEVAHARAQRQAGGSDGGHGLRHGAGRLLRRGASELLRRGAARLGMRAMLRVAVRAVAVAGAAMVGSWLGGKLYEWLDKSGALTKTFDGIDTLKAKAHEAGAAFKAGFAGRAPLDASGRQVNDPRRTDATPKTAIERVAGMAGRTARAAAGVVARPVEAAAGAIRWARRTLQADRAATAPDRQAALPSTAPGGASSTPRAGREGGPRMQASPLPPRPIERTLHATQAPQASRPDARPAIVGAVVTKATAVHVGTLPPANAQVLQVRPPVVPPVPLIPPLRLPPAPEILADGPIIEDQPAAIVVRRPAVGSADRNIAHTVTGWAADDQRAMGWAPSLQRRIQ